MNPYDPALAMIAREAGVRPPHVYHQLACMRHLGAKFNPAVYAEFSKLELRHVESIIATLDRHGMLPKRAVRDTPRGTRLPADWSLPDDWRAFASNERHWTTDDITTEASQFADYWRGAPKGIKLDWFATWRNWVRNSRRPSGTPNLVREGFDEREAMQRTAALYDRMGRTNEAAEIRARLHPNVVPLLRQG